MTTTERTTAPGGDEAAEQHSAPNPDAGVVGDLVEALRPFAQIAPAYAEGDYGFRLEATVRSRAAFTRDDVSKAAAAASNGAADHEGAGE